jgi:hypothetical protein
MKPKELKTEYLDLGNIGDTFDEAEQKIQDAKLKKLMDMLRLKRKIVVVAGAGISVSAGSMFRPHALMWILLKLYSSRFPLFYRPLQYLAQPTQAEGFREALV